MTFEQKVQNLYFRNAKLVIFPLIKIAIILAMFATSVQVMLKMNLLSSQNQKKLIKIWIFDKTTSQYL